MTISEGDSTTFAYTGRLDDGTVFDTSRGEVAEEIGLAADQPDRTFEPLTVEVGAGQLIEGLEDALVGLEDGAETTVEIPPEQGYGEYTDDRISEYGRETFDEAIPEDDVTEGMVIQTQQGGIGDVVHVDDESVRVDFNHELAGETLEFEIEILDVE
ncbi:FKBP-type peptidyl-prolyl cis-trans isomerase [Natronoglomus mannanivorans]|uniref:Peptidyl-prolyl cis-trans isomerase n=1 Tax=Natronoglomus mannanivorans TaxID=2979990 RepID=A0AAP2Z111_9EURY|nr:FKBP-type peptidyl-prolyl cis-trans isomerase [Halobacteria archaeon AArc-xg1-1]